MVSTNARNRTCISILKRVCTTVTVQPKTRDTILKDTNFLWYYSEVVVDRNCTCMPPPPPLANSFIISSLLFCCVVAAGADWNAAGCPACCCGATGPVLLTNSPNPADEAAGCGCAGCFVGTYHRCMRDMPAGQQLSQDTPPCHQTRTVFDA